MENHLAYIAALTPIFIIAMSIGLGFFKDNWFIEFGLAIVVISAGTSMILAFMSGRKAAEAKKEEFEMYIPPSDEGRSHSFKFTAGMMGVDTQNPYEHLQKQIDEIKQVAAQDERTFKALSASTDRRVDICLALIRFHEEVTLPKILGRGTGAIILAGVLTIIGSAYLAVPIGAYQVFAGVAGAMRDWLPAL